MSDALLVLLIVISISIGWLLGRFQRRSQKGTKDEGLGSEYFRGLNYLLNEQPDQAIDIFIKELEVNSETVETHLALGSLFRRRGEVDRAIKIHQNLLTRDSLDRTQQENVKLALARDYLTAGLLDRAERLLQELVEDNGRNAKQALQYLLSVFEQEKEWGDAIITAEKLLASGEEGILKPLAHYCCELAESSLASGDVRDSRVYLQRALQYDRDCVRASLLQGQLEFQAGRYQDAIQALKKVKEQDAAYVTESVEPLGECYHQIGESEGFLQYLKFCLDDHPAISIALLMADKVSHLEGEAKGTEAMTAFLKERPSVKGFRRLIDMQLSRSQNHEAKESLTVLRTLAEQLEEHKPDYQCTSCGFNGHSLHWLCPTCKKWGHVKPLHVHPLHDKRET
ncbi:MAG: lipopolysaccharide assembly protein LapB [Pseudomonadales bacterium]|nr:lipopolysaccharide assembly protein LapB [Pseudomonadales bacterium]